MLHLSVNGNRRRGAVTVESALVYSILFFLLMTIVVLGITVFRYQQMAHCAREASRYASVHGMTYEKETGNLGATRDEIFNNVVVPHSGLPAHLLTCTVTWDQNNKPMHSVVQTDSITGVSKFVSVGNTVTVTVSYQWNTIFFGTIPVSSTSTNVMSY